VLGDRYAAFLGRRDLAVRLLHMAAVDVMEPQTCPGGV
jgi:hypothetical protein